MNKLFTYKSLSLIDFGKLESEFDLIITSYNETAKLLRDNTRIKVISIGSIVDSLFGSWNDKELDYSNIVAIRKELANLKYISSEVRESFIKSIDSVYKSIKEAKELRITPEEYRMGNNTLEDQVISKLMEIVYIQDSFIDFDLKLFNYENDINIFKNDIYECLEKNLKSKNECLNKELKGKILIQGFYYITPIQEIVFNYFRKAGIEIVPAICYDDRYKSINKIVDNTFENYKKECITQNYNCDDLSISDVYASILDGEDVDISNIKDLNTLEFKHYDDLNIYNKDILKLIYEENQEITKERKLYAVNRKEILNRISIFRGDLEESDQLSIKYYPLGIFLKEVYNTWDSKTKTISLSAESLIRIFECNLLEIKKGCKSSDCIEDLNTISMYFSDCNTIEEWIERIDLLNSNRSNINCDSRNKILVECYGPFSISRDRIDLIKEFLILLRDITDMIFFDKKGNIDTAIVIHLNNLCDIIEKSTNIEEEEEKENNSLEYQLLKKIKSILENKKDSFSNSARNEYLFTALNLYISEVQKSENLIERKCDIYPLDSIEAVDENVRNIYIYDFNRDIFPQEKFKESIFLRKEKLENISENREKNTVEKNVIDIQLKLQKSNDIIGRYIFWLALKNTKVNKTIYRLVDDRDNKHFYQYVLENKLNKNSQQVKNTAIESKSVNKFNLESYKVKFKIKSNNLKSAYLYMYCPLRLYFWKINDNKEVYVDKLSAEHFIPSVIANIYNNNNNAITLLNKFNQYSSVIIDRLRGIAIYNTRENNNNDECFWMPEYLKIKNQEYKNFEKIDYLYGHYISKNEKMNISDSFIPISNNGKSTCTYCSFKYICVEKDLSKLNYPSDYWIGTPNNLTHIEKAKQMRKRYGL